jgi:hypothetical protein
MQSMYSGRDLYAPDLTLFFDGLHELEGMERRFHRSLQKSVRAKLLEQLRRANWTCDETTRISETIARRINLAPQAVLEQITELATGADDGCQLTAEEIDIFLLGGQP